MIRVWDTGVRIFHWSLVAIVISNRFVNDTGGDWHEWLGYTACFFIVLRLLWGWRGARGYNRFASWREQWPAREELGAHLRTYLAARAPRMLGHPPLAQIGMVAMLACVALLGLSGWMLGWDRFWGDETLQSVHGWIADALLIIAAAHVMGVIRESWIHRENLVAAMIHGRKRN